MGPGRHRRGARTPPTRPQEHLHDTLVAGVGLCDVEAVTALVTEGPPRVRELVALGAEFDRDADGRDLADPRGRPPPRPDRPRRRRRHRARDLAGRSSPRCTGAGRPGHRGHRARAGRRPAQDRRRPGMRRDPPRHRRGPGRRGRRRPRPRRRPGHRRARPGLLGRRPTPSVATGDGMAAALRAGAVLADVEFVQFHPTVLWLGEGASGQQPLISEAVRGEGAFLVDARRRAVHAGRRTRWPTSRPRDVVARAIVARMRETGTDHVYLDARHLGARVPRARASRRSSRAAASSASTRHRPAAGRPGPALRQRRRHAPTCTAGPPSRACTPAARSSCTGVHGANRLASNSLLEGLVFAHRIADDITARLAAGELPADAGRARRRAGARSPPSTGATSSAR